MYSTLRWFFLASLLGGCQSDVPEHKKEPSHLALSKRPDIVSNVESGLLDLPPYFSIEQVKGFMADEDYELASRYVNAALGIAKQNPFLHTMNGFIYEERAARGDPQCMELAEVAYKMAYNLCPHQWIFPYLLGQYYLRTKNYIAAQKALADALLLKPRDDEILYHLAYASYALRDFPVAVACIRKAVSQKPTSGVLRKAACLVYASVGDYSKAEAHRAAYMKLCPAAKASEEQEMAKCIDTWKKVHAMVCPELAAPPQSPKLSKFPKSPKSLKRAQSVRSQGDDDSDSDSDSNTVSASEEGKEQRNEKPDKGDKGKDKGDKVEKEAQEANILIEGYILSVEENAQTWKGANIVESFAKSLEFSITNANSLPGTGFWRTAIYPWNPRQYAVPGKCPYSDSAMQKAYTFQVSKAILTYTINIANASDNFVQVQERPTICTTMGKPGNFNSGDRILGFSNGSLGGASPVLTNLGIVLQVTPQKKTKDGRLLLKVKISGTVLKSEPESTTAITQQLISVGRTELDTEVCAAFDETLMIGGLYEHVVENTKAGFPLLQDIPFLQYLFSSQHTDSHTKSTLVLLTPRRGTSIEELAEQSFRRAKDAAEDTLTELSKRDLLQIDRSSPLKSIFAHFAQSPMLQNLSLGNFPLPASAYDNLRPSQKLDQLAAFIYF